MKYFKHEKLNEDKSNMESVVLSFLPIIKRTIIKAGIEETEDLVHDCLLSIIETLNKEGCNTSKVLNIITFTIYKYVLRSSVLSGFYKLQDRGSLEKIRFMLECFNSKDEEAIKNYFKDFDHNPNRVYILMDEESFDDYYDECELDLETKIVNKCYIEKLLEYLKPRERAIIEMLYGLKGEEYSALEIANMLNVSDSWINKQKQDALKKLRSLIGVLDKKSR